MISEHNMGYGVRLSLIFILLISVSLLNRELVTVVSEVSGGHCILIGFQFHNAFVMHKNLALIHIRWFRVFSNFHALALNLILTSFSFIWICNFFSLFRSPTMAGGLLAAHREYFFEIGGYGSYLDKALSCSFVL